MKSIIQISPLARGQAVYRARALYMTVNDTLEYNDSLVCRQLNYFREAQVEWEQKNEIKVNEEKLSLQVFPNCNEGCKKKRHTTVSLYNSQKQENLCLVAGARTFLKEGQARTDALPLLFRKGRV